MEIINRRVDYLNREEVNFFDNALSWASSRFKDRRLMESWGESGHYFENLMISDFLKWGASRGKPVAFNFWEKSSVFEIDLVIYRGDFMALDENVHVVPAWAFS